MKQYLYLKTHNLTGKKYLGQTVRDPFTYKGSGTLWRRHLKRYGNDVTTEVLFESDNRKKFTSIAIDYSKNLNVVESKKFLNLIDEDGGLMGGTANPNYKHGALVGQYDNPEIRKQADKVRNAERHTAWKKPNNIRDKARYYVYRGNKNKAKELFEQWQDLRMSMPMSTKGKYKRNRLTFKEWTAGLKYEL
tara:strand:- start:82 stop:654 length:573 start_codon:yes stop_codon:yes gene_type:complete